MIGKIKKVKGEKAQKIQESKKKENENEIPNQEPEKDQAIPDDNNKESIIDSIEKRISNIDNADSTSMVSKTFPMLGNLDNPCNKCGKTSRMLLDEGEINVSMINLNLDNPEIPLWWCPKCLQEKKKELMDEPSNRGTGLVHPANVRPRVRPQVIVKNQDKTNGNEEEEIESPPTPASFDVNSIFQQMNSELKIEKDNELEKLEQEKEKEEDVGTLRRMIFEWPDRSNKIFAALRYIDYQIEEFNAVLERAKVDYKNDKNIYRNKKISRAISIIPSRFYVKNSRMLSRIINATLFHLDELWDELIKKFPDEEDMYYSYKSVRGAFIQLHSQNNVYEGTMSMLKQNSKELRKTFSAIEVNTVRLAIYERKLGSEDSKQKFLESWSKMTEKERKRHIANNLDTTIVPEMEEKSQQKFYDALLKQEAIKQTPQELALLFQRFESYDERITFLKLIKPSLKAKELDQLVRGTIYQDKNAAEENE